MYDSILVATDASDNAGAALEHALDVAAVTDATVYVVTVVDPGSSMRFGVAEVEELDDAAREVVDEIVDAYVDHDVEIRGDVRRGKPVDVLLGYADEIDAGLIVVGQHGDDGLSGAILGSTTDRLARLTTIPVLVVPAVE